MLIAVKMTGETKKMTKILGNNNPLLSWIERAFPNGAPLLVPVCSFDQVFENQTAFQEIVTKLHDLPVDNTYWFSYHMQAMIEELGELLGADKRWKTHRNEKFDIDNKTEELADVFITAMNLAIFSGLTSEEMHQAIVDKIKKNTEKLLGSQRSDEVKE